MSRKVASRKVASRKGAKKRAKPAAKRAARATKAAPRRRGRGKYLRARTVGIRLANRFAFGVLIAMGCVAIAILALPQVRELQRLESELTEVEAREQESLALKDRKSRELSALRNDPEYLELVARDRLGLYVPGERVVRVKRPRN